MQEVTRVFINESATDSAELILNQPGEEGRINILYIAQGNSNLELNYKITQQAKNTHGEIFVCGLLLGDATKTANLTIDFNKGAKGATGKVAEHVMVLSESAKNISRPIILCAEEDVKGEHGVSVGHLEESELEYLMARGISKNKARQILIKASLFKILSHIQNPKQLALVKAKLKEVKLDYAA